ncbi:amidohydrolase family protein [Aliidiomarina sp. Khilg15.8]
MRGRWRIASTVLAALGTVSVTATADQTTPVRGLHDNSPSLVALQNATLVTEPGTELSNATLVIENGKITAVSRNNRAPKGARVIDATGYTIYPGFIDPYSNYGVPEKGESSRYRRDEPAQYNNKREGGNASNDAIHAEVRWVEQLANQQDKAKSYVEQGFTSVQSARMDGIFRGQATQVSLADKIPNSLVYKDVTRHVASFDKGSSQQQYPNSLMGSIALIRQTLADAQWYSDAQGKQTMGGLLEHNAALAALSNLSEQGVIFETSDELDIARADQVFKAFDIPVTYVGSGFEYARLNDVRATESKLILPLNFPAAPELAQQHAELDVSLKDLRHWERAPGNAAMLAEAGIDFAFTLHGLEKTEHFLPNVRKAIDHGLSREKALAALTTEAARIAGVADKAGRLAPGYTADFIVSRGDLFSNGEIASVWLQGQETRLKPMHPTQFAGEFALNFANQAFDLTLNESGQLSGEIIQGDNSVKLQHVSSDEHSVSFVADLSAFELPGRFRFSLSQSARDEFAGSVVNPQGEELDLQATRESVADTESDSRREAGSPEYMGSLTLPNIGLGNQQQPEQQNLHIRNATVWTSADAGVLENADIIVRNGRIQRVGENLSTPRGYATLDAEGMHITAGIIDEHSHIAISKGVNEGTEAVTSEVSIGDVVNPDDVHIYRSLAGGTTTAHLLHGSANPIGGQGQTIKLRWGENAEGLKFTETPATIKMALGENVKQSNWGISNNRYPQTRMGVVAIVHDYFRAAKEYRQAQRDYDNLSRGERRGTAPPRKDYRLEALLQILDGERNIHAHSYVASEILALMEVADELGFKIHTFTHILEGYKVAEEMAAHGANASSFADWWAYKIEAYDAIPQNACVMMDKGVLTSVNSDSDDLQRRMNIEAAKSVRYCGMSEEDALKMITLYPAQQMEVDEYVGSIEEGKHADLVIWNNHPLSAYAQVQQTWIEGRKYFDREQDLERRDSLNEEKHALIQKVLAAGSDAQQGSRNGYKQEQPGWHCETNHDVWLDNFSAAHQHGGH